MTVHTICDRCGMEYAWAGVTVGDRIYCCEGCAAGGACTCPRADGAVVAAGDTVVVSGDTLVVPDEDEVVIVR